jgi:hypothetical protein
VTRRLRIDLALPDLAPAQAEFLWSLFDQLVQEIWQAYELDILDALDAQLDDLELDHHFDDSTEIDDLAAALQARNAQRQPTRGPS